MALLKKQSPDSTLMQNKILNHIYIIDVEEKLTRKFTYYVEFSVKTATRNNNLFGNLLIGRNLGINTPKMNTNGM